MPTELVDLLCSPADLTLVDRKTVLARIADIRAGALGGEREKERLDRLAVVIDDGVGFTLYDAVEDAKRSLSAADSTRLRFDYPGAELDLALDRSELEAAAQRPIDRMLAALDETLRAGELEAHQVEIVCLTGGTSRMPMIERALRERLPKARFRKLRSFHSVVQGLARRAREVASA